MEQESIDQPNGGLMPNKLASKATTIYLWKWRELAIVIMLFGFGFLIWQGCELLITDTINLTNNGTHENGILVDGMKNGSFYNDEPFKGTPGKEIDVGNFTAPPGKIIAFTRGRAPMFRTTMATDPTNTLRSWTPGKDPIELKFGDEYKIDVYFWIIAGHAAPQKIRAWRAYNKTVYIWEKERQGIRLGVFNVQDRTEDRDDEIVQLRSRAANESDFAFSCTDLLDLASLGRFTPNNINIYYLTRVKADNEGMGAEYGAECPGNSTTPGIFILMGNRTSRGLLPHELGHALGLDHVDQLYDTASPPKPYFTETNVMHPASSTRNFLTEGQTFRAVAQPGSALNVIYNARPNLLQQTCMNSIEQDLNWPGCPPVQTRIWDDQ